MNKDSHLVGVGDPVVQDAIELQKQKLKEKLKSAVAGSTFAEREGAALEVCDAIRLELLEARPRSSSSENADE
ncbi:MAG: hypothetical protein V3V08_26115 [Nannocystaceae bacterium]